MLKAILVDDEQLSIHMMENLIEWDRYGVRIVATAADGLEALEKFREHVPNIVITDIKMPNLDGIEFIRRVREISVDAEIIFISAYADFSYVKEAIALGCSNYLLKPVDEMELEKTLQKITQKISEKSISRKLALKSETQKKKKILRDYLRSNANPTLGRKFFAEFCPEGAPFLLMSITQHHETIEAYTGASSLAGEQIVYQQERIEKIAGERAACLALEDEENTWLLALRTGSQEDAMAIAQALQRFLQGEGKTKVRICFSRSATKTQELPALYAQVKRYEKYGQHLGDVGILGSGYRNNEEQYSQLVREGIDFLAARYDQNLSLDEICRHLSISKNYFSYLFKRDTGVSLWAYLTGIRMRRAKALLRDTNLKSLEIAYQIGYDNPSYFSKLFKKQNGQTPNEYRLSARKEKDV